MYWFRRLINIGCNEEQPASINRPIRMTNASVFFGMFTHIAYGLFYLILNATLYRPALIVIGLAILLYLLPLWLNWKKHFLCAGIMLNLVTQIPVFINLRLYLGHVIGNHYFFILFSLLPLITLPTTAKWIRYALSGLAILFFFLTFQHMPDGALTETLGPTILQFTYYSSSLLSLLTVVAVTGIYQGLLHKSEAALYDRTGYLDETMQAFSRLATEDALTSLPNRRRLDRQLQNELTRADRSQTPFSIVLFDLDLFKNVNDLQGHDAGDEVLKNTAKILQNNIRQTDMGGRWGGEEFMILLPHTDLTHAMLVAEKIRSALESSSEAHAGAVTASFGVAQAAMGELPNSICKRADIALYMAKNDGRNRVIAAPVIEPDSHSL